MTQNNNPPEEHCVLNCLVSDILLSIVQRKVILLYVNTQHMLNVTICRQSTYIVLLFIKMSFKKSISTTKIFQNSSKIKVKHYNKNEKMVISQPIRLK